MLLFLVIRSGRKYVKCVDNTGVRRARLIYKSLLNMLIVTSTIWLASLSVSYDMIETIAWSTNVCIMS